MRSMPVNGSRQVGHFPLSLSKIAQPVHTHANADEQKKRALLTVLALLSVAIGARALSTLHAFIELALATLCRYRTRPRIFRRWDRYALPMFHAVMPL